MLSGIPIVMTTAVITVFVVVVAITIISVICGYEQDRERGEPEVSPRKFWLLLSLLVGGILITLVLFITLIWSFFV